MAARWICQGNTADIYGDTVVSWGRGGFMGTRWICGNSAVSPGTHRSFVGTKRLVGKRRFHGKTALGGGGTAVSRVHEFAAVS